MILLSILSGLFAGALLLFFSHLAPWVGAGHFVRDTDAPRVFGREITRREAHVIGIFVHLMISGIFAGFYGLFVWSGVLESFHLLSILGWSIVMWFCVGSIVLPLEGHGFFGMREDAWFPADLLLTNLFWGILFWWMMRLWSIVG